MKLDLYFGRRFLRALLIVLALFGGLILMVESLDQLRDLSDLGIGGAAILQMALLRVPRTLYEILPIIVMIATLVLFLGLARSSELVVARAAGRSALRSLVPPMTVAFLFGVLSITVFNPIAATSERSYERRITLMSQGEAQVFSVSDEGLWLREGTANGQMVIRASRSNLDGSELQDVSFVGFAPDSTPLYRIEAQTAEIEDGQWHLRNAKRWPLLGAANPEVAATLHDDLTLPTSLSPNEIRDRFGAPEAVPFWELTGYIEKNLGTGIDSGTLGHRAGDIIGAELEPFFNVPDDLGFEGFALFFQGMAMPNGITERAKGLKDVLQAGKIWLSLIDCHT